MTATLVGRIRADLEAPIRAGHWPPGFRIPTERDLMARYGCSRMTVSQAVGALARLGLIDRRKKAGSFVAAPRLETAVLDIPDIAGLIAARGEAYRFERLERALRPLDGADLEEAALTSPEPVLAVSGLHFAGATPFALERRVLNLTAVPQAREVAFDVEGPGSWLLGHVPWTQARHRILAITPDAETAARLALPRRQACLMVERHTWRAGDWITFARLIFPGDLYSLTATFGPERT